MGGTILSLFWSAMWEEQGLLNLPTSKAQRQIGWQCQGIGELIGSPMPTSMAKLCPSKSPPLMEKLNSLQTLCLQIGILAKLFPAKYSFLNPWAFRFSWVSDLVNLESSRGVLNIFYLSSPPYFFGLVMKWSGVYWWSKLWWRAKPIKYGCSICYS